MQNLIDPITADLIFTCLSSAVLLAGTFKAMVMLPWTDAKRPRKRRPIACSWARCSRCKIAAPAESPDG